MTAKPEETQFGKVPVKWPAAPRGRDLEIRDFLGFDPSATET